METIVKCENVCKKIGKKEILKNVSFEINSGDILAFIGPNGAGKTTTIKLMLGLQKINKGHISINGYDIKKNFVKAISKVGAIVENPDTYMYLSGYENLKMAQSLYGIHDEAELQAIIKKIGLEKRIKDKVSKYSLGMRQRLGIGLALVNHPNLLILDEPTNGLDPEGIRDLRNLLKELAKEGMAIFVSSHNLAELESFCNKVVIIQNGVIIDSAKTKDLKHNINEAGSAYTITIDSNKKLSKKYELLDEDKVIIKGNKEDVSKAVSDLVGLGKKIYLITEQELSLEEAFLKKTGGNKID